MLQKKGNFELMWMDETKPRKRNFVKNFVVKISKKKKGTTTNNRTKGRQNK